MRIKDIKQGVAYFYEKGKWSGSRGDGETYVISTSVFHTPGWHRSRHDKNPYFTLRRKGDTVPSGGSAGMLCLVISPWHYSASEADVKALREAIATVTVEEILTEKNGMLPQRIRELEHSSLVEVKLLQPSRIIGTWDGILAERAAAEEAAKQHKAKVRKQKDSNLTRARKIAEAFTALGIQAPIVSEYDNNHRLEIELGSLEALVELALKGKSLDD